ncbi:hypothetical protein ACSG7X_000481 [Vibrio fluvialis]
MPKNFAKLFEFDDIGQVLVVMNTEEPEFSFEFDPCAKSVGRVTSICRFGTWEEADSAFEKIDREYAYKMKQTIEDTQAAFGVKYENA